MPAPTIEDVRPILQDFEPRIRKVLEDAWNEDWMKLPPKERGIFDKTTRANCLFSYIKQRAIREFASDAAIQMIPHHRSIKFLFKGRVLLRIKKGNRHGLGSNISTQAVIEFVHPQLPLFTLPSIFHIEVCYQEDIFANRIESIAAVCRLGAKKLWSYELQKPGAANVIPLPVLPSGGPLIEPATARPRAQPVEKADERGE